MRCCGRPGERRESTLPLQAEAAEAAEELGARVACLGGTPAPPPHVPLLTRLAYWLRVRALDPGHDERSPAELHVVASNRALAEVAPSAHEAVLLRKDAHFAAALRTVCADAARAGGEPPPAVLAVVGATHVEGIAERLQAGDGTPRNSVRAVF